MLYEGPMTKIKSRHKFGRVSAPEAVWLSVVPPSPPAKATARVYCTLTEPNWRVCPRLAVPEGDISVSPPISVMLGRPLIEPVSVGVRRLLTASVGVCVHQLSSPR